MNDTLRSPPPKVETTPLEALIVKPGEILIIRINLPEGISERERDTHYSALHDALEHVGLDGRVLIVAGDVKLAKLAARDSYASADGLDD